MRPFDEAVAWHDVECGGYDADLSLWRELAAARPGPVLELGAGAGRVALDLAAGGHEVTALDSDPDLVAVCSARARARGLRVDAVCADARSFALGRRFSLVLAPMQVVQLLQSRDGRRCSPGCSITSSRAASSRPPLPIPSPASRPPTPLPPLPDTGVHDGWALASTPVAVREEELSRGERAVAIDRLRRAVSPTGETVESAATVRLSVFPATELAASAVAHGFRRLSDRSVPDTEAYVGSTVLMLEASRRP